MRLQIALDTFDTRTALATLEQTREFVDIAEIGTGLGIAEGASAIRAVKAAYPDLTVLSDVKIMDGGESLAGFVLDAGADIVSVLGVTDDATVQAAVGAARERGKEVLADMIGVHDIGARAKRLDELGVTYVCVHTPYDLRESVRPPVADLEIVQSVVTTAQTVVTGGVKLHLIDEIVTHRPDVVIVGSGIMAAADQRAAAQQFAEVVHGARSIA